MGAQSDPSIPRDWRLKVLRGIGRGLSASVRLGLLELAKSTSGPLSDPEGVKAIEQVLDELREEQRMEERGGLN